jgi:hypothetical protein
MPDPETEELHLEQLERERAERKLARFSHEEPDERTHERRADRHAYLRDKLAERAESEDEVASDEDG